MNGSVKPYFIQQNKFNTWFVKYSEKRTWFVIWRKIGQWFVIGTPPLPHCFLPWWFTQFPSGNSSSSSLWLSFESFSSKLLASTNSSSSSSSLSEPLPTIKSSSSECLRLPLLQFFQHSMSKSCQDPAALNLKMCQCNFNMYIAMNSFGREKQPKKIGKREKESKNIGRLENQYKKGGRRMFFRKMWHDCLRP